MNAPRLAIAEIPVEVKRLSPETLGLLSLVIVSIGILVPAIIFGVPSNLDLSNHFRFALPFYDSISSGDLYPSWLAESNSGYGDPSFRFYPPGLYYLLALTRWLTGGWYSAILLVFTSLSVVASLGIYFWARSFLPATTAMWAGVFYAVAPYHVNQLYQASMLAEYAACAILPFAFGFVERIFQLGRRRDIAGLALVYALVLFTHLPIAIIGSLALLLYALVRLEKSRKLLTLVKLALGAALGLCASAVYWVTMVTEMGWIAINNIERDASVDYRANFLLETFSADNLNVWWMNILALMTLLLFMPLVILLRRHHVPELKGGLKAASLLTIFAVFMALPLSRPLWYALAQLQQTQFPWRWLALVSMGGSILAAASFPAWHTTVKPPARALRILVCGGVIIAVAFTLSHVVREAQYLSPAKFQDTLAGIRGSASVNYWFPVWARSNPLPMQREVAADGRFISVNFWQAEHREFSVAAGPSTEARIRTFYYPHWVATSESQILSTRPDKDGALLISLPASAGSIKLDFQEPQRSRTSGAASLLGFAFIGALALPTNGRRRS
jgi:hypothetical protein